MATCTPFSDSALLIEFGKRIAALRLCNNWTQADLAQKAGVSKSTVEHLEKGESTQLLNLIKILRACDLLSQFLDIVPSQEPSPMEILDASRSLQRSKRKRASKPRETSGIAVDSKPTWIWGEDK